MSRVAARKEGVAAAEMSETSQTTTTTEMDLNAVATGAEVLRRGNGIDLGVAQRDTDLTIVMMVLPDTLEGRIAETGTDTTTAITTRRPIAAIIKAELTTRMDTSGTQTTEAIVLGVSQETSLVATHRELAVEIGTKERSAMETPRVRTATAARLVVLSRC